MPKQAAQAREIVEAYERDREYVALELHDNVLQTLASALHHIQAATRSAGPPDERRQNLLKALRLVHQSLDAARGLMTGLKPPVLDRLGLVETLRYDLRQLQRETKWQVQLDADAGPTSSELELPLYRILREAITNARNHSICNTLRVRLLVEPSGIQAEVQDNGIGFDPTLVHRDGVGLLSMRVRAKALGGECQILSLPGQGTAVRVRVPIREGSGGRG